MARSYAKLLPSIWRDPDFVALDAGTQRLYMLLISQPDLSPAGVLPLRLSKWAKLASDTEVDAIEIAFGRLVESRFIIVDHDTEEVLIRSFIRHDGGFNHTNFRKSIVSAIGIIESSGLQAIAGAELDNAAGHKPSESHPNAIPIPSETHRERNATPAAATTPSTTPAAAASSRAETSDNRTAPVPLSDAAAAAVEMLVQHRLDTAKPDTRPRYAAKARRNIFDEHGTQLHEATIPHGTTDPARWLAVHVLGLSTSQAMSAATSLRAHQGRAA